jgi:hypothetical protein
MEHVCVLVGPTCNSNLKLVKKHVVPLVALLLGEKKSKRECAMLCGAIVAKIGPSGLLEVASGLPPPKKKLLEELISKL